MGNTIAMLNNQRLIVASSLELAVVHYLQTNPSCQLQEACKQCWKNTMIWEVFDMCI